jgi:hypothetical protein
MMARKKLGISIGIIFILIVGCLIGYFGYYVKTPEYSLGIIKTSIQKHDWETFSKHVDSDQLLSSAYDGFVGYALDKANDDTIKAFAGSFIVMMKPGVVKEMNNNLKRYVETGDAQGNHESKDKAVEAADNLKKQTNFDRDEYKGIAYTKKNDNIAVVGLKIYDKQLTKEFIVDLKMRELSDGTWQVIEWSNAKECLEETDKAKEEKLAELNGPLQEKIDGAIAVQTSSGRIMAGDPFGISKKFNVSVNMDIKSDRAVSQIKGEIKVMDADNKELMKQAINTNLEGASHKNITKVFSLDLNPFMGNTKKILQANLKDLKIVCKITELEFADGDKVELLTQLPESK